MNPLKAIHYCGIAVVIVLFAVNPALCASDVLNYFVLKEDRYWQSTPYAVGASDLTDSAHSFSVFGELASGTAVTAASVMAPGGAVTPITLTGESSINLELPFETRGALDATYPNGTFTVNFQTAHDGPQSLAIPITGDAYPNLPQVANLPQARGIDATADFTLEWVATGLSPTDLVVIEVEDQSSWNTVFSTGLPGAPDALPGNATSVIIPANTLKPGHIYHVSVVYVRITSTNNTYGSGTGAYVRSVSTWMRTNGADAADTTAPQIQDTVPWPGTQNVARNACAMLRFSEPMNNAFIDIAWTGGNGFNPANVVYRWNSDGPEPKNTRLYVYYNGLLPANTQINYTVNPAASSNKMRDAAGNLLASDITGQFTTAASPTAMPADVSWLFASKTRLFRQTSAIAPTTAEAWFMEINGGLSAPQTVPDIRLRRTSVSGASYLVALPENDHNEARSYGGLQYVTKGELDAFFPNAIDYTLNFTPLHETSKIIPVSFGTVDNYPDTPRCANFTALQTIDAAAATTVQWDAFTGAGADDVVVLSIENERGNTILQTPMPGQAGVLAGTATSHVLPAGALSSGRSYRAFLYFGKNLSKDTTTYPGVPVQGFFSSATAFGIHTTGNPQVAQVTGSVVSNGYAFQLAVKGEPLWEYDIFVSSDLQTWHPLQRMYTDNSGQMWFHDFDKSFLNRRFYRLADAVGDQLVVDASVQGTVTRQGTNEPVAGATVGTSLDGATTTTGPDGSFFLQTHTGMSNWSQPYAIHVQAAGFNSYSQNQSWGTQARGVQIHLTPPL
ncbi:MAG: Ig-like domain-containing domain [Verrucomicrobia bacterium]|nr:Ig-like domain-containing domain [Verrucomicrobiota bacterium]